jgi:hypothetical protein
LTGSCRPRDDDLARGLASWGAAILAAAFISVGSSGSTITTFSGSTLAFGTATSIPFSTHVAQVLSHLADRKASVVLYALVGGPIPTARLPVFRNLYHQPELSKSHVPAHLASQVLRPVIAILCYVVAAALGRFLHRCGSNFSCSLPGTMPDPARHPFGPMNCSGLCYLCRTGSILKARIGVCGAPTSASSLRHDVRTVGGLRCTARLRSQGPGRCG